MSFLDEINEGGVLNEGAGVTPDPVQLIQVHSLSNTDGNHTDKALLGLHGSDSSLECVGGSAVSEHYDRVRH